LYYVMNQGGKGAGGWGGGGGVNDAIGHVRMIEIALLLRYHKLM